METAHVAGCDAAAIFRARTQAGGVVGRLVSSASSAFEAHRRCTGHKVGVPGENLFSSTSITVRCKRRRHDSRLRGGWTLPFCGGNMDPPSSMLRWSRERDRTARCKVLTWFNLRSPDPQAGHMQRDCRIGRRYQ